MHKGKIFGLGLLLPMVSSPSAWNIVRQHSPPFEFQKLIWYPSHCPKMSICLLIALQHKLLTQDWLVKYGILQNNVCPLYKLCPETVDHLCFECNYAKYTWVVCKLKLGLTQQVSVLVEEARVIMNQFSTKSKASALAKLALGAAVWHVWKVRNSRIFEHQELSSMHRSQKLRQDILVLVHGTSWKEDKDVAKAKLLQSWAIPV